MTSNMWLMKQIFVKVLSLEVCHAFIVRTPYAKQFLNISCLIFYIFYVCHVWTARQDMTMFNVTLVVMVTLAEL